MSRPAAVAVVIFHFRCDIISDVNMPLFSIRSYINVTYSVTANTFDSLHKAHSDSPVIGKRSSVATGSGWDRFKMANEKRLILGHVIPHRAGAPITHGPVPVRTHKHSVD